jgi:hypothetical protein
MGRLDGPAKAAAPGPAEDLASLKERGLPVYLVYIHAACMIYSLAMMFGAGVAFTYSFNTRGF